MEIVTSEFPTRQRLADAAFLRLGVENSGDEAVPEAAITIEIAGEQGENSIRPFSIRGPQEDLAAPDRPVWILENDYPRLVGEEINAGAQTANEKTFAFGSLDPGESVEAVWKVTPVKSGDFTLTYEVDAGLQGKAKAKTPDGGKPRGSFVVEISDVPPQTRVTDDGRVVEIEGGGAPAGDTAPSP